MNRRDKNESPARLLLLYSEKTTLGNESDVTAIKSQIREITKNLKFVDKSLTEAMKRNSLFALFSISLFL